VNVFVDLKKYMEGEGESGEGREGREHAWGIVGMLVVAQGRKAVEAAVECGLQNRLLSLLSRTGLEEIKPIYAFTLSALAYKGSEEGAVRLIGGGAVLIGVRLLEHGNTDCVTAGILVLMNLLLWTWGTDSDGVGHGQFGVFREALADTGLHNVFGKEECDELQKRSIVRGLLLLYKNREIPGEYGYVCEHGIELLSVQSDFLCKAILELLVCVVGVGGLVFFFFLFSF
jgi:hypothetical protein